MTILPKRLFNTVITCLFWVTLLSGCQSSPPASSITGPDISTELANAISENEKLVPPQPAQLPEAFEQELLSIDSQTQRVTRFNISAERVPAQQFFADLMSSSGDNILVDPQINNDISLTLRNVTIADVLGALTDLYGYEFSRTEYGYRVMADRLLTRIFQLNYLNVTRSGSSDTSVAGSGISNTNTNQSSQVNTEYSADFWSNLEQTLKLILTDRPGRTIVLNAQAGIIVVRANPDELRSIERFLAQAEFSLQQQVIIEARILEVTLSDEYQTGINWNTVAGNNSRLTTDTLAGQISGENVIGPADQGGVFSLNFNIDDFTGVIQMLSAQGQVQVLSSPRISTVNNQKAVIKVGNDDYYVTNVTSTGGEDPEPQVELTPFFSGIALDVTPQIGDNREIILHVRPSVTEVTEQSRIINLGTFNYQLPLASLSIREADSIIRAQSGQIVVIGGLLQNKSDNNQSGLPMLSRVPGLKFLFSQQQRSNIKSELVILLQPRITSAETWRDVMDSSRATSAIHP